MHGFISQGYMVSSGNNYLSAKTRDGAFAPSDAGIQASIQLTDKFRVGAQGYARKIGALGQGKPILDWAFGDYRFKDWLGIRAGKVKTVFGLYNDTQDMSFLHTWALLPQSIYPMDLRGQSIAHTGADLYGNLPLGIHAGDISYTVFAGRAPADYEGGRVYGIRSLGTEVTSIKGSMWGADLRWNLPVTGLMAGASRLYTPNRLRGYDASVGANVDARLDPSRSHIFYIQYTRGPWRLEWERYRWLNLTTARVTGGPPEVANLQFVTDVRSWYGAGAYRFSRRFELGAYHSRNYPNGNRRNYYTSEDPAALHVFDSTVTLRVDFAHHWDFKIEGHHIQGYGDAATSRGFYPQDNPQGLRARTELLILRLGFNW